MNDNLLIRMEVPIPTLPIVNTSYMIFHAWVPVDDPIEVKKDHITYRAWIDRNCIANFSDGPKIEIHANMLLSKIMLDVTLSAVSQSLKDLIQGRPPENPGTREILHREYENLGREVLAGVLKIVNSLITYAKSIKGQYWLQEYPEDIDLLHQFNMAFKSKAFIDEQWERWSPSKQIIIKGKGLAGDEKRWIEKEEWSIVCHHIAKYSGTPLVLDLLSGAEQLAGIGKRRNSLAEAITALEVAVFEFSRNADESFFPALQKQRISVSSLEKWISKAGLSAAIHYIFPVIFSEDQFSTEDLRRCRDAITERQNVIHNGQRDVSEEKILSYLKSIRNICEALIALSKKHE